jgi:hypothetical protein
MSAAPHVGMILASTWGYDQTNVDFYEVIRATAKTVTLRQIKDRRVEDDVYLTYRAEPIPGAYIGAPFRRKIADWSGEQVAVSIDSVANAYQWNGRPVRGSSYA